MIKWVIFQMGFPTRVHDNFIIYSSNVNMLSVRPLKSNQSLGLNRHPIDAQLYFNKEYEQSQG